MHEKRHASLISALLMLVLIKHRQLQWQNRGLKFLSPSFFTQAALKKSRRNKHWDAEALMNRYQKLIRFST